MPIRDSRISTARGRRYRVYLERTAPGGPAVTRAVRSLRGFRLNPGPAQSVFPGIGVPDGKAGI